MSMAAGVKMSSGGPGVVVDEVGTGRPEREITRHADTLWRSRRPLNAIMQMLHTPPFGRHKCNNYNNVL